MKITIYGTGCPKCQTLTKLATQAISELGINAEIVKETSIEKIVESGVMMTPALAIDGKVKLSGKLPTIEELKTLLKA